MNLHTALHSYDDYGKSINNAIFEILKTDCKNSLQTAVKDN